MMLLSRRGALRLVGLGVGAVAFGACAGVPGAAPAAAPAGPTNTPAPPSAAQLAVDGAPNSSVKVLATLTGTGAQGDAFKTPNGVAVDSADESLYIADSGGKRMLKFDQDGKFVLSWEGEGQDALNNPVDVAVGPTGTIHVLDRATGRVITFNREGRILASFSGPSFYAPFGLTATANALFVADTGTGRVLRFSLAGELQQELSKRGPEASNTKEPTGLTVEPDGTLVVADGALGMVMKFNTEGKLASSFDAVAKGLARVARLPDGSLVVSDPYRARLLRYDAEGKLLGKYGQKGNEDGRFDVPTGVTATKQGHLYIADSQNHRVQKVALE